jgi:hypothetical protein
LLAQRLQLGRDAFILHQGLGGNCPHVLVEALVNLFLDQLHQVFSNPTTGLLPIEQAFLNVGNDGSIENVDAVYALLRVFSERVSRLMQSLVNKLSEY